MLCLGVRLTLSLKPSSLSVGVIRLHHHVLLSKAVIRSRFISVSLTHNGLSFSSRGQWKTESQNLRK